jgi:hypothetical protein
VFLNIFHLYRLADPDEYEDENGWLTLRYKRQRWWYKLAQVCRQWRNIILESPSWLDLDLYCTFGVPVADMLAHSPPLPLTIYYPQAMYYPKTPIQKITAEDESGILLALSHRDRIRRIDLRHLRNVEKFFTVMGDQFPILERVYIHSHPKARVVLPETFQAPNLRHLVLSATSLPIGSPLLTTAAGLVTLELLDIPASAYFPPSYLLTRLSLMAQLKRLSITFFSPIPNRDVERQLHQTPDMVVLPHLRFFLFRGTTTYLEGLVGRISTPFLNQLQLRLNHQPPFIFPRLLQFIQTSQNLGFTAVQVAFGASALSLYAVPPSRMVWLRFSCVHLDCQVTTAAQLFGTLSPVLSVVEQVTFSYEEHQQSSESHNNVDRSRWRELLRPFTNAKTIHVHDDLVSKIFCSDDGEPPLEFLPNLEVVGYSGGSDARDAFITFLNERQVAGRPVTLRIVGRSVLKDQYY